MYADYLLEREGKIYKEYPKGFITYGYDCVPGMEKIKHVYIQDLYVKPEFRKEHVARDMANAVCKEAREKGYKLLIGSVSEHANGKEASKAVLRAYGMEVLEENADYSYFCKGI